MLMCTVGVLSMSPCSAVLTLVAEMAWHPVHLPGLINA